ncbi:hypothetical protein CONPUDRAFT_81622 [Coniophora puteana RWD-64-598 SS2]|uniref:RING-type domain-containing protein n=1 Tax=Coniophora puteana (strain RWD-64-598) TaxID=741705 RepID=A0A5M3MSC6_CONPW|nr:uncharacterized protein CONPUDRAFT_81622 [Coniophora puteana RWD-64-598 SS2]EIW82062.1 hypothetical protein CONPUDRAFT_81622 [Coniophora puteana RWD-64-598 SS2]
MCERIQFALDDLPVLPAGDIPKDDSCPICLLSFASIIEEKNEEDADAVYGGVTKVTSCGHVFCRKDLSEWIKGFHGSCPTCRHPFVDIQPPEDSDAESSDGDYFPNEEDDDDDDMLDTDGFDDEFEVDEIDLELESWGDMSGSEEDAEDWGDAEDDIAVERMAYASSEAPELDADKVEAEFEANDAFTGPSNSSK